MGGKSKSQIVGYKYSLYAHFIFGAGVADFVSKIWFRDSDTIAWQGKQDVNGIIAINKPDLFGGQSSQGGVVGNIAFMNGAVGQAANTYQVGFRGALTPAYRGVMGIIWQDLNIGMNPYLPTWGVEWSRIHKRMSLDGITDRVQWYDAKSAIPFDDVQTIADLITTDSWNYKWFSALNTSEEYKATAIDLTGWTTNQAKASVPFVSNTANFPISDGAGNKTVMWYRWNFTPNSAKDINLSLSTLFQMDLWLNGNKLDALASGSKSFLIPKSKLIVGANNVLAIRVGGGVAGVPEHFLYKNPGTGGDQSWTDANTAAQHYVNYWNAGRAPGDTNAITSYTLNPTVIDATYGIPRVPSIHVSYFSGNTATVPFDNQHHMYVAATISEPNTITIDADISSLFDMNPVHIIREAYTELWGRGFSEDLFPDAVWQAAADTVYSEGLGMTAMYDGSQSIDGFISEICRHIAAEVYKDRRDGKFKIKLIRNDYNIATIPSFNESNIIDMSKDDTPVFGKLTTKVVVNYTDTSNAFVEASITVSDIALQQQQGKEITANLDYKGFTSGQIAGRKAQQMLNTLSKPLQKRSFIVRMSAGKDLNKGDVFKFSWARENIVDMVMRITDMNFGNGISNRIKIDAVQDEFAMPTTSFIAPPTSDWTPPFSEPTALNDRLIVETPYLELVQLIGQVNVDNQILVDVNSSYVTAMAGTQSNATKAMMYDGISTYSQVGIVDFCPTATLNAACGLIDTTLTITGGKLLDQVAVGTWFQLDNELMRVDAISDTSMTVGRGCLDTIPATHSIGAVLHFWDNASLTDSTEFVTGNTVNAKLLTINPKGQLALVDAPVDSVTMVGRAARPYNMANVKLNGTYYASSVTGDLVLTWANRNRLQQTSGTIYDFDDGNITPESGVTYSISILDRDGTVGYSVTGVTGTTATILTSDLIGCDDQATLKIVAVRSGITSYQTYLIPFTNTNSKLRITTTTSPRVTTDGTFRRVT